MEIKEPKTIFVQIAERLCDEILLGHYKDDERIPSVREYAALVEVNANTIVRSYDYLQGENIIYNKRGLGYFVSPGAAKQILSVRQEIFRKITLPEFVSQVHQLNIPLSEIDEALKKSNEEKP